MVWKKGDRPNHGGKLFPMTEPSSKKGGEVRRTEFNGVKGTLKKDGRKMGWEAK